MSTGSYSGSMHARKNPMSQGGEVEIGRLTGLPIIPCPRCGDRILELRARKKDGEIFFKYRQNDQDVPYAMRKCNFYKLEAEYADVAASWGLRHGINFAQDYRKVSETGNPPNLQRLKTDYSSDYGKMDKLIKLCELILVTNVVMVVLVSLAVAVMVLK